MQRYSALFRTLTYIYWIFCFLEKPDPSEINMFCIFLDFLQFSCKGADEHPVGFGGLGLGRLCQAEHEWYISLNEPKDVIALAPLLSQNSSITLPL